MKLNSELLNKAKDILNSKDFSTKIHTFNLNESEAKKAEFHLSLEGNVNFDKNTCFDFIKFCLNELNIINSINLLTVVLSSDKDKFQTFAFYDIQRKLAAVYCDGRHVLDCFRSLAHELVHFKQDIKGEISTDQLGDKNDGVQIENEANSLAGIIMRKFGRNHSNLY